MPYRWANSGGFLSEQSVHGQTDESGRCAGGSPKPRASRDRRSSSKLVDFLERRERSWRYSAKGRTAGDPQFDAA